jgi:hypothetical protein
VPDLRPYRTCEVLARDLSGYATYQELAFVWPDFRRKSRYDLSRVKLYNRREHSDGKTYGKIDFARSDSPRRGRHPFACVRGIRIDWHMAFPRFIVESTPPARLCALSNRQLKTWNFTSPVTRLIVHWKPRGLSGWPNAASYCFCRMRHRQVPTNKTQAKPNTYHDVIAGTRGSTA